MQEVGQGNAHSEATLTVWVAVLHEVVAGLLVGHDLKEQSNIEFCTYGVGLGDLDELVDSLWVVRVLIWVLLPTESSVGLLNLRNGGILSHSEQLVRNESLQRLDVSDDLEAHVSQVPEEG